MTRKKILKMKIRMKDHQRNMEAAQLSPPTCSHEAIKRGYKGYESYKDLQYRGMICRKKGEAIIEECRRQNAALSRL
jgi:hypothetical protein